VSDALPLPSQPNLELYKKLAKELQAACNSGDPPAVRAWAARWLEKLARLRGVTQITIDVRHGIDAYIDRIMRQWGRLGKGDHGARYALANAQFFIARCHGFESWPKFTRHLEALRRADSSVSKFERAADAIVSGDKAALDNLLAEDPKLAHARSTREHRSTLLHYVSANGVEDFRQKTPSNIVEITKQLLAHGADVNAESEAYGGGATALGLTATSVHPEAAGVQLELLQVLVDHGARIDPIGKGSAIRDCLANGRGLAAEFLATRGARIGLEEAGGIGRLDIVQSFFDPDGSLRPPATQEQVQEAFTWACQFGRTPVVEFLLGRGIEIGARLQPFGQTGLHWAAYCGHAEIVAMLLRHGAPIDVTDDQFKSTPLAWALYSWGTAEAGRNLDRYYQVVGLLARAGAKLDPEWAGESRERKRSMHRMRSDPRMMAALRGEVTA